MATDTPKIAERRDGAEGLATASVLDEILTSRQVAELLQMRVSTVEEYARRGLLPSVKLGRHRRFVHSQVEQAIATLLERQAMATGR